MSQIGLEPLTAAQSAELVEELLPAVRTRLRESVLVAAEGNPFFAEEIVRHLIDEGVLARSTRVGSAVADRCGLRSCEQGRAGRAGVGIPT
jgi:predicted ATPase